jgi:threonine/homoserine/homoserine lactone efflux protein
MWTMTEFLLGLAFGWLVAAQPGPVTLLLIRTAARSAEAQKGASTRTSGPHAEPHWRSTRHATFMIGLAAASVDTVYAALGATGAASLLQSESTRVALGLVGGVVLVAIGMRSVRYTWRTRSGLDTPEHPMSPAHAFATGVAATASNPLTIASWAAIFAAASVSTETHSFLAIAVFVTGIGTASLSWFSFLTLLSVAALRRIANQWKRFLEIFSGAGLVLLGVLLGSRALLIL